MSALSRSLVAFTSIALLTSCSVAPRPATPPAPASLQSPTTAAKLAPGDQRVLLVMVDGLPGDLFGRALAAGALPRLAGLMAARPTLATTALSTFPSATSPSVPELLSGRYCSLDNPAPGAVHAFDREQRRVVRYLTEPDAWQWPAANLFDAAREAGLASLTVFEGRWDGPRTILTRNAIALDAAMEVAGISEYDGDRWPVNRLIRELRGPTPPQLALLVFNAVDLAGHFHGPDSLEAWDALVATDALLGEVVDALAEARATSGRDLLADTTLLLFGDHGMVPSGRYLDLQPFFQRRELVTFDASSVSQVLFRERLGRMWTRWPDALLVSGGSNVTQVYFRWPSGAWGNATAGDGPSRRERTRRRPADLGALAAELAEVPGVAQVIRPLSPSSYELRASGGRLARVERSNDGRAPRYAYVTVPSAVDDPLGYLADPAIAPRVCRAEGWAGPRDPACRLTRDEWIELTASARYPAAIPLLAKAFDPPRFAGDLMVTALPGWSFLRGQRGDHGNLEREAMLTPLVLNGPGVEAAARNGWGEAGGGDATSSRRLPRLVDIYPTAAVLLGASPDDPALAGLDGIPLLLPAEPATIARPTAGSQPER